MNHQFYSILVLIIICTSCNSPVQNNEVIKNENKSTETKLEKPIDVPGCYRQVRDRDTIIAILKQTGNEITGTLKFDNYGIDGSSGKLQGVMEGEILKLKYNFFSEGMNSIMDIYFKYKNDSIIRGVGEMRTNGDSSLFIDHTTITYSMQTVLKKVHCNEVNF